MIDLERHIEILLLSNDCVIVPNLGGFVAHHVEAKYDSDDGLFLPPLRTIGFNPKLSINDSLLAQSYVDAYDISYPEAVTRLEDDVNQLKTQIENDGHYEINGIGVLSINQDGNYEFEPFEAGILTPTLYGLNSVEINMLKTQSTPSKATGTVQASEKHEVAMVVTEPGQEREEDHTEAEPRTISIRVSTLRNIAAVAAVLLALFLLATPLEFGSKCTFSLSDFNKSIFKKMMPKEIVKNAPDASKQLLTKDTDITKADIKDTITLKLDNQQTELPNEQKEDTQTGESLPKKYYSLVLASCIPHKNAVKYAEELKTNGFDSARVIDRKNGAKVIYGTFDSEAAAYQELSKLHQHAAFKEAWVYFVKY